jgi:hypothetical protein
MDKNKKQEYLNLLTSEGDLHEIYSDITDSLWWRDKNNLNNREREKYLYERFVDVYDMLIEEYSFTLTGFFYIHDCKEQLDLEFQKLIRGEYR